MEKPVCPCGRSDCPNTAPLRASPSATTWASPSLVVCTCGVTYRYGSAHSCVLNGTLFTTPATDPRSLELEERNARSLQRIAVALEKLVGVFVPE